jgi:hypothetical protein
MQSIAAFRGHGDQAGTRHHTVIAWTAAARNSSSPGSLRRS